MKRFICLLILVVFALSIAPVLNAQVDQDGNSAVRVERGLDDASRRGPRKSPGVITAEELADYDDEEEAAWHSIQRYRLRANTNHALALAAAITIGIAVLGGALAQGKVASAAMEGIARNPEASSKLFTPLVISLALIESLVIYALVIAFLIQGKL